MKLEELVTEISLTVATIKEKLDHTVTWKELSGTALALFCAICAGVWFLVAQIVESKLTGSEARLQAVSIEAVDTAKDQIVVELQAALKGISAKLEKQQTTLLEVSASIDQQRSTEVLSLDFVKSFDTVSQQVKSMSEILSDTTQTNPAYVTFNSSSPIGEKILASPEWGNFAKTWGLDAQSVINTGQIIVPFGDIKPSQTCLELNGDCLK